MRIISFILSLYVVLLTTLPCKDSATHKGEINSCAASSQSHSGQHETDRCSPFCVCDCCNTVVTAQSITDLASPSRVLESELCMSYTNTSSYFFQHIWQPPKLS